MAKFQNNIALVTGASRGLGAGTALALAQNGAHVIAVARTAGGLEELDDRIQAAGGSATLAPMDITDTGAVQRLCASIFDRWGGLDLWVHAAIHATPLTPTPHIDDKDWNKSVRINITATKQLISNVEPLLIAKSGTAVHIDDTHLGAKFFGTYAAAKAAQNALFASWMAETQNSGLTVKRFAPNPMPTATRARFYPGEDRSTLSDPLAEAERLLQSI